MSQLSQEAIAELREHAEAAHGTGDERLAEQLTLLLDWHEATEHDKGVVPLPAYETAVISRRVVHQLYRESASSLEALKAEKERLERHKLRALQALNNLLNNPDYDDQIARRVVAELYLIDAAALTKESGS